MPLWRCPHCATPQAEAARCWVCRRSSTSCATCRNFRLSVASQVGYCGLDRRRAPLRGDEIRPCWASAAAAIEDGATTGSESIDRTGVRAFDFVPVGEVVPVAIVEGPERVTLWGEPDAL